jgi:hypothetical protein
LIFGESKPEHEVTPAAGAASGATRIKQNTTKKKTVKKRTGKK